MTLRDNEEMHRFEAEIEGLVAVLKYMRKDGLLHLVHTEVPEQLRGQGVAGELAKYALESARAAGVKVKVICPSVAKFLARHPEYSDLVDG